MKKTDDTTFLFMQLKKKPSENLYVEEYTALTISSKYKDIGIQKSDKENSVEKSLKWSKKIWNNYFKKHFPKLCSES